MFLKNITLQNFKNYRSLDLSFDKKINCFIGMNGVGKTNLLDSLYYLCITKSYFHQDQFVVRHGANFLRINGSFILDGEIKNLKCILGISRKKEFCVNDIPYQRLSEHVGNFPVVIVTPYDNSLILGGSEERRKFIDSTLSQTAHAYLDHCISYNKILAQRNAALKKFAENRSFNAALIATFDEQLIRHGEEIHRKRKEATNRMMPVFLKYYQSISGVHEPVSIAYISSLNKCSFGKLLKDNIQNDRLLQRTTVGIHRDDIAFTIGNRPLKKFGSQGQQKSFLLALKLTQYQMIQKDKKIFPLLLLDDIFSKLDQYRVSNVLKCLSTEHFGQIFITDTEGERINRIFDNEKDNLELFEIEAGKIVKSMQNEPSQ